jgi:acetylornithine deacetylase/succinyl-diaminopimelate desuccinylase-like protein
LTSAGPARHHPPSRSRSLHPAAPLTSPALRRARELAHGTDDATLRDQLELVRIPAPPFGEAERGAEVLARFHALGFAAAAADEVGNVVATLSGEPGHAPVVVAAHLDTVFPAGTDVEPRFEGGRIYAPGITDNTRGLAGMLAVARAARSAGVRTRRPVHFVATVGEEGTGDLRGVKHLFRTGSPLRTAAAFVALDGSGMRRIVQRAIGSRRLRVTVEGPGGHSWADRGSPNPIVALGAATAEISTLALPHPERSSLTVARIGGGTSINAIPDAAWMELDMRSEAPGVLPDIEASVRGIVSRVVREESNGRRTGTHPLRARVEVIGDRPSGETAPNTELVRIATRATAAVGGRPELVSSSTDANVPMALGIPSIAIGVGGDSGGIHTTEEWYSNEGGASGVERALIIILEAAGAT